MTSDAMAKIPNTLLSRLLLFTVPPYNKNTKDAKKSGHDTLQIKELHSVGNVIHAFSHIKKTYRTQWVVLEGGEHPPSLRQGVTEQLDKHEETSNTENPSNCRDGELSTSLSIFGPMWTKLEDIPNVKYVACHC
jgi:A/G-specific adenine glycosylase